MSQETILELDLGPRSYALHIGSGLLAGLGERLRPKVKGGRVAVITNETVAPLYLEPVTCALRDSGFAVLPVILPDGESHKHWGTLQTIFDHLIEGRFERSDALLALGGGVIGDMTGFAAASYLRGVAFAQVPTTLLAQVDASVGGKTGINHRLGKNLIGAFHQPCLVLMDVETLRTLPERERLAGMAEVIKYGIIRDAGLFSLLEERLEAILALETATLTRVLRTCCAIKAEIVAADEREHGTRALLNLGHTFGHAIEALTGYDAWLHGEAVAAGMAVATRLAESLGLCDPADATRIRNLLTRAGLPVTIPARPVAEYLEAMSHDKKVASGKIRYVLPEGIGKASVQGEIPAAAVEAALAAAISC
ncbi:MAG: 3-dehydroquinate synthase [Magnetococcales bacterium]|nr:3-dehydroquinate synthase [Magnetococcales bacterium]